MLYHKKYFKSDDHDWVVFIHGAGGSSAIWYKQLKSFRDHFNILLLDLRGHGRSANLSDNIPNTHYSFEMIAKDIIEVINHLKIEKAHFVGVSLGTLIIRQLGDMIGPRIQSMVLVGAITHFNFKSRFWVGLGRLFKNVLPYMWLYRLFAFVLMPARNHAESRNIFVNEAQKLCQKEFLRWYRLTGQLSGLFNKFEVHLPIPTLYVMGEQDYMFLDPIQKMIKDIKTAALLVVAECGHVVNIEKAQEFNEHVTSYILNIKQLNKLNNC